MPTSATAASKAATTPPQFLSFHLHVLQSLEFPKELNHSNKEGGGSVDASFWTMVRNFLQEREALSKQLQQASSMKEIHEETLSFMEEQRQQSAEASATSPPAAKRARLHTTAFTGSTGNWSLVKKESPGGSFSFASPYRYSHQQQQHHARDGLKCAGLVSKLLKKRSLAFESTVQKRSSPYMPVLRQVEAQILTVEHQLQIMREDALSKKRQAMEDLLSLSATTIDKMPLTDADHSNVQAKMSLLDTKLELWNMLASDLRKLVPTSKASA